MKVFGFSTLVLILIVTALNGCKPGCKDVHCLNNGECMSGGSCKCPGRFGGQYCDSLCPIGYEGNYCNIESRNKFVRTWNATTSSNATGTREHTLYVTNGPIPQQIIITNFNNEGYTMVGTILDYNSFQIYSQNATGAYTGLVSGSGYINGSNMAMNLNKQGVDYFANCNR
jgi:hypothetical protein